MQAQELCRSRTWCNPTVNGSFSFINLPFAPELELDTTGVMANAASESIHASHFALLMNAFVVLVHDRHQYNSHLIRWLLLVRQRNEHVSCRHGPPPELVLHRSPPFLEDGSTASLSALRRRGSNACWSYNMNHGSTPPRKTCSYSPAFSEFILYPPSSILHPVLRKSVATKGTGR